MNTAAADSSPPRIPREWVLVVDDDQKLRELLAEQLLSLQVGALVCNSGEHALQMLALKDTAPTLALVDVMMPGMNGLALARRLLARFGRQTKIVIISGHLTDASWWPVDLREVTFLPKPFRLADLERLLIEARALRGPAK